MGDENFSDNHFHNFCGHFDVLPNISLTQVRRCAIITYKIPIYELPNKLLIDLRLRILINYEVSGKFLNFIK